MKVGSLAEERYFALTLGKTIGIIGMATSAAWLRSAAAAFGMAALGYDPFLSESRSASAVLPGVIDELYPRSDFISCTFPCCCHARDDPRRKR